MSPIIRRKLSHDVLDRLIERISVGELRKIGREARRLDEHRNIVDRIAAHDVYGAAAAMLQHQTRAADLNRPRET